MRPWGNGSTTGNEQFPTRRDRAAMILGADRDVVIVAVPGGERDGLHGGLRRRLCWGAGWAGGFAAVRAVALLNTSLGLQSWGWGGVTWVVAVGRGLLGGCSRQARCWRRPSGVLRWTPRDPTGGGSVDRANGEQISRWAPAADAQLLWRGTNAMRC